MLPASMKVQEEPHFWQPIGAICVFVYILLETFPRISFKNCPMTYHLHCLYSNHRNLVPATSGHYVSTPTDHQSHKSKPYSCKTHWKQKVQGSTQTTTSVCQSNAPIQQETSQKLLWGHQRARLIFFWVWGINLWNARQQIQRILRTGTHWERSP